MDAENRLMIAPNATNYIPVEEGTYDITLYQHTPGVRVFYHLAIRHSLGCRFYV